MYPARFDYEAPTSLDEVVTLLAERGEDAKVLAGGQSLVPLLKLRLASPDLLVDLGRVPGLAEIRDLGGGLSVGALVRHAQLAESALVRERFPVMAAAAPLIADPLIRNRGTLAGSLVHADPAGDWASVMLALGASVRARSSAGEREIAVDDFLEGPFATTIDPTEVVTEVLVPGPRGPAGGTYLKLERRVGDFATVGVAVQLELAHGADGTVARAGIALTAVGPRSIGATDAERALAGAPPGPEAFAEAADLAARAARPSDDLRGSADYKRNVVRVFVRRGLERALELARSA